jgi:hypothetical protein
MSPEQQKKIVTDLCNSVRDKLLERIDDFDIPEEWDGLELRQLVAEVFWQERTIGNGRSIDFRSRRARAYHDIVLVENLDR